MKNIALGFIFKYSEKILPFITRRLYSLSKLKEHIDIDVRSTNPVSICLNQIPKLIIYFKITNKSPYEDIVLYGGEFSIWLKNSGGSQPIGRFNFAKRKVVKKGSTEEISFSRNLNKFEVTFAKEYFGKKENINADISTKFYFSSVLYPIFEVEVNLDNKPCKRE
ncbi:MAG: hypothetical protein J7K22_02450 [Nanoarchaeota archaeon]|nr:hypothetical protein [Nanoarchaeota archaeon]